jgi:hypothetical protein
LLSALPALPARGDEPIVEATAVRPASDGPDGRRAFDDLAAYYENAQRTPDVGKALSDLRAADPAQRSAAGRYLLALFRQSFADERNGRARWRALPFFGGGSENPAREFRKRAAAQFGDAADGEAAIDPAQWLINKDRLAESAAAGVKALCRVRSPQVTAAFRALLSPAHPNSAVAVAVVEEVGRRGMKDLAPEVKGLCGHYRTPVRDAARKAAAQLGIGSLPEYKPEAAFTPWLDRELKDIAAMVLTPLPAEPKWKRFTVTLDPPPNRRQPAGEPQTREFSGWLLGDEGEAYKVLDLFAGEDRVKKARTKLADRAFADDARSYLKVRSGKDRRETMDSLSRRGGLTGQFEPGFVSLPEVLLAAWSYARGDKAACAAVLFPRLDEIPDERWIKEVARDLLGREYHEQMLHAFCYRRDYPAAQAFALHLSKPLFNEYQYHDRAVELAAQLNRRGGDFKTLKLPTAAEWAKLQQAMARRQQVDYLAQRLRLVNCFQWGQPGGVNYADTQYDRPTRGLDAEDEGLPPGPDGGEGGKNGKDKPVEVINPYVELRRMRLEVRDLPPLVPYLGDDDYIPTFSYWRDFHPGRTLHRANWLVAQIVNDAAKRNLADVEASPTLDAAGKQQRIEKVMEWVRANADKTRPDLLMETARTSKDFREFAVAAAELVQIGRKEALPVFVRRLNDFREDKGEVAEMCFRLSAADALPEARKWVKETDEGLRFWAAMVLLRAGDRGRPDGPEGLAELRPILEKDDGDRWFPSAMDELLATRDEKAIALACTVLSKPAFGQGSTRYSSFPMIHRLLLAGRKEALDYVTKSLDDTTEAATSYGNYQGQEVQRRQSRGDLMADAVAEWRSDGYRYESLGPDDQRAKERDKLKNWVAEQFELIKAGKPHGIKMPQGPLRPSRWQLDAP